MGTDPLSPLAQLRKLNQGHRYSQSLPLANR